MCLVFYAAKIEILRYLEVRKFALSLILAVQVVATVYMTTALPKKMFFLFYNIHTS